MPARSRFTAANRQRILEVLQAGGSRREAARAAGVAHATVDRWVQRGRKYPTTSFGQFRAAVLAAEAAEHRPGAIREPEMTAPAAMDFLLDAGEFDFPVPDPPEWPAVIELHWPEDVT